jgi:hypothetical protein
VSDEGLGIPAEQQGRIFEKFFRLDPGMTRGVGGTGLGLYVCSELVERMGGRIWVESNEGRGSTFFCELPLAGARSGPLGRTRRSPRERAARPDAQQRATAKPCGMRDVLLVVSNRLVREVVGLCRSAKRWASTTSRRAAPLTPRGAAASPHPDGPRTEVRSRRPR